MLYCKECGAILPDETPPFCPACGAILNAAARTAKPPLPKESHAKSTESVRASETCVPLRPSQVRGKYPPPMSTFSFYWSLLLLCLPAVGLVTAVIWASGGAANENRRNLGRAALLLRLTVLGILLTLYFAVQFFLSRYGYSLLPFGY